MKRRWAMCVLAGCLFVPGLFGDGGTVQLRKPAGPWMITIFSTPGPLRAGTADLSVMVQMAKDQSAVLDAQVKLRLNRSSATQVDEIIAPANRAQASNKLLYAARVTLPSPGRWQLEANVTDKNSAASVSTEVNVLPAQAPLAAHWLYIALAPLVVLLFVLNRLLKRNRDSRRSRVLP